MHLKSFQELVDIKPAAHSELKCLGFSVFILISYTHAHTRKHSHTHTPFIFFCLCHCV